LWRSPQAYNAIRKTGYLSEEVAREAFPTPQARDWKGAQGRAYKGEAMDLPAVVGGQLNPTWVGWLMGFPIGWTDLKPLAMDKFREWWQQHGGY